MKSLETAKYLVLDTNKGVYKLKYSILLDNRSKVMTGLIYKATNVKNGKTYVGKTTGSLRERKNGHLSDARCNKTSMYFHRAINKYGEENFEWDTLVENVPVELLSDLEINCIAMEASYTDGYNLTEGGETNKGWKASAATRKNMSKAQKGRTFTEEAKAKMSDAQCGTKSHKFSPWFLTSPDGVITEFYDITIKEYAKQNGLSYGNLMYRVRDSSGIPAKKGVLKGCIGGLIKDLYE